MKSENKITGRCISEDIIKARCDELGLIYIRRSVVNGKTRVTYLCPKHLSKGEITSQWTHLRTAKYGCPYCSGKYKSTDDFKIEVKKILPSIDVLGEYKTQRTRIDVQCEICGHRWSPEARSLLYGEGCPVCARRRKPEMKRKPASVFIDQLNKISPNIIAIGEYLGTHKKIECTCTIHNNRWESYPCNLLNKSAGCPICAIERMRNEPSKGEVKISNFLDSHSITYFTEHVFDDCVYKRHLRFDFFLPLFNLAIEYDGFQHFNQTTWFHRNEDDFENDVIRDKIKDRYCEENGIRLLRIPFYNFEHIEDILNNELKEYLQSN